MNLTEERRAAPEERASPRAVDAQPPRVAILLGTANGARYLAEQLESIASQSWPNWVLHVSDDGSTDGTLEMLEAFGRRFRGRVTIHAGPRRGFALNFLSLACSDRVQAEYFAFCDQDDIWMADRLERSVRWLQTLDPATPALYCGRTVYVDTEGRKLGLSPLFSLAPAFRNALVQSLAGGNTMTFNQAARRLLMRAGLVDVVTHDWWVYQVVTGAGGVVHYDPEPLVEYRQHGANLIGSNVGFRARMHRARQLLNGRFVRWTDLHLRALASIESQLSETNRDTLNAFRAARNGNLIARLRQLRRSGVYRQTVVGSVGLWVGALANRL
jgi:glycosyltransferase involved in cell wall biosynthesis